MAESGVFEVEFTDNDGHAVASLDLKADQLLVLHYCPLRLSARSHKFNDYSPDGNFARYKMLFRTDYGFSNGRAVPSEAKKLIVPTCEPICDGLRSTNCTS
jgi:hypothetical protein